jgi:hypothetical protein
MKHYSIRAVKVVCYVNGKPVSELPYNVGNIDEFWFNYEAVPDDNEADSFGVYELNDPVEDGVTWQWIADFKHRSDAEMFALEKENSLQTGGINHECGN